MWGMSYKSRRGLFGKEATQCLRRCSVARGDLIAMISLIYSSVDTMGARVAIKCILPCLTFDTFKARL